MITGWLAPEDCPDCGGLLSMACPGCGYAITWQATDPDDQTEPDDPDGKESE